MNLYDRFHQRPQQPQSTGNPILDMFGSISNFNQQFNQFANQMRSVNTNPQEAVQNLLSSGQMSQDQFNKFSQIANMITGYKQF